MVYEILGLVFYFLFLGIGVILYAFSRGLWKPPNPEIHESAEAFRQRNTTLLRVGGLALIAIMSLNAYLSLKELFGF